MSTERVFRVYEIDLRELTKSAVHDALIEAGVSCHRPGRPLCELAAEELMGRMGGREEIEDVDDDTTYGTEHRWFAWHPVNTRNHGWKWLRFVRRQRVCYHDDDFPTVRGWVYEVVR